MSIRFIGLVLTLCLTASHTTMGFGIKKPWAKGDVKTQEAPPVHVEEIVKSINKYGVKKICEKGDLKSKIRGNNNWSFRQDGSLKNTDELRLSLIICASNADFDNSTYGKAALTNAKAQRMTRDMMIDQVKTELDKAIKEKKDTDSRKVFSQLKLSMLSPGTKALELAKAAQKEESVHKIEILRVWNAPDREKYKTGIDKAVEYLAKESVDDKKVIFNVKEKLNQLFAYVGKFDGLDLAHLPETIPSVSLPDEIHEEIYQKMPDTNLYLFNLTTGEFIE